MDRDKVKYLLGRYGHRFQMTGSRYICDPPPMDTDEDYVVQGHVDLTEALVSAGFVCGSDHVDEYDNDSYFESWRKGDFNIIMVYTSGFYDKFVKATEEAKRLNLTDKKGRIEFFQGVLYEDEPVEIPF